MWLIGLHLLLTYNGDKVTKDEAFSLHHFPLTERHRRDEEGAVEGEGVELPILAAGVHRRRQLPKEGLIVDPAREGGWQGFRVHANHDAAMAPADEIPGQGGGVAAPQGENARQTYPLQHPFPIGTDIRQEEVTEGDSLYPLGLQLREDFPHLLLIFTIGGLG